MAWKPILEGALADQCLQAVRDIGDRLFDDGRDLFRQASPERIPSLSGGKAGQALFYERLGEFLGDDSATDRGLALLDEAIELMASSSLSAGLFGGFTGVGWAYEHLLAGSDGGDERSEPEESSEIDDVLFDYVEPSPWGGSFDLVRGLAGYGVYALEALPRRGAIALLERLVLRLEELAVHDESGLAWFTAPPLVPLHRREEYPDGYFDTGVAHGIPGLLTMLTGSGLHGIAEERCRTLVDGAVRWLLEHRLTDSRHREFPPFVAPQARKDRGRAAWCYGAPGVAAALGAVALAFDRRELLDEAVEIAYRTWTRPAETSQTRDAGLCHGAAGLGHIYNRLFQASGDERMLEIARSWFERALGLRVPGLRVAGFASLEPRPDGSGRVDWVEDGSLMSGAAGVGLAMLAALDDREPTWDRALALSVLDPAHGAA